MGCGHELYQCPINPIINPKPVSCHEPINSTYAGNREEIGNFKRSNIIFQHEQKLAIEANSSSDGYEITCLLWNQQFYYREVKWILNNCVTMRN
jgi:hypothetical protein